MSGHDCVACRAGHCDIHRVGAVDPMRLILRHPWHRNGRPTVADLEVIERPLRVAWVWERADNPGVSITNAAEHVFCKVRDLYGPDYRVVECYGPRSYRLPIPGDERQTFDLVDLDDDGEPVWRRLGTSQADALGALVALVLAEWWASRLGVARHPSGGPTS